MPKLGMEVDCHNRTDDSSSGSGSDLLLTFKSSEGGKGGKGGQKMKNMSPAAEERKKRKEGK